MEKKIRVNKEKRGIDVLQLLPAAGVYGWDIPPCFAMSERSRPNPVPVPAPSPMPGPPRPLCSSDDLPLYSRKRKNPHQYKGGHDRVC